MCNSNVIGLQIYTNYSKIDTFLTTAVTRP